MFSPTHTALIAAATGLILTTIIVVPNVSQVFVNEACKEGGASALVELDNILALTCPLGEDARAGTAPVIEKLNITAILEAEAKADVTTCTGADSAFTMGAACIQKLCEKKCSMAPATDVQGNSISDQFIGLIYSLMPSNLVLGMGEGQLLGLIVVSVFTGLHADEHGLIMTASEEISKLVFVFVQMLIVLSPPAVFSLVLPEIAGADLMKLVEYISLLYGCFIVAESIHLFGTYPLLYFLFTRKNPYAYMRKLVDSATHVTTS